MWTNPSVVYEFVDNFTTLESSIDLARLLLRSLFPQLEHKNTEAVMHQANALMFMCTSMTPDELSGSRLKAGRVSYGDRSFSLPPERLAGEVEEELMNAAA